MSKYIIKNCEQIHSSDNFCWSKNKFCQDCSNCVIKQIVELCKACYDEADKENDGFYSILKLLDIEEVE